MRRRLKVLLLVHPYFRPDRKGKPRSNSERNVWRGLQRLGFNVQISAVQERMEDLERDLVRERPHIVFNLLEEFRNEAIFDFHPVSFLESKGVAYTGCNPQGLIVSRNKFWAAQVTRAAGVLAPFCWLASDALVEKNLPFPLFVKFNSEHASMGVTVRNLLRSKKSLRTRVKQMAAAHDAEILIQEFIPGSEFSVSIWGNKEPTALSPWELYLGSKMGFATERIKFSQKQQRQNWILARQFRGGATLARHMKAAARAVYKQLGLTGYARFDFRVTEEGRIFLIDVNANPNLARDEDFALAARHDGIAYEDVLRRIVRLGLAYEPRLRSV